MSKVTYVRRLAQLVEQVENHPYKDEILKLAYEQLLDDQEVTVNGK